MSDCWPLESTVSRPTRFPIVIVAACLLAVTAGGQAPTRIGHDEPEILLNHALVGRSGACDALEFVDDGKILLAAGDDKVVHRWAVTPDGLRALEPGRWNTFRERRGAIYTLAVRPNTNGRQVFVAGNGKLTSDGAVLDLLAPPHERIVDAVSALNHPAHKLQYAKYYADISSLPSSPVWSSAWDANGSKALFGLDDGAVWLWTVGGAVERVALPDPLTSREDSRVIWVGFTADGTPSAINQRGDVLGWPGTGRIPGGPFARAAASPDGTTIALTPKTERRDWTGSDLVLLWAGDRRPKRKIPFADHLLTKSAAFNAAGNRLAVLTTKLLSEKDKVAVPTFATPGRSLLEVYDLEPASPRVVASELMSTEYDRVAFHPNGEWLAVAGGANHDTRLFAVAGKTFRPVGEAGGVGRAAWAVGVTADGKGLSFQDAKAAAPTSPNARGSGPWRTFDLERRTWTNPRPPVPPLETLDDWRVETHQKDTVDVFTWYLVDPANRRTPLPWDRVADDRPYCYTFVPDSNPVQLAVGHYWGVSVFELVPGLPPRRVRRFTGHAGGVVAVAPAFGGKGLVSAGRDLSVCLWSLADWKDTGPVLGASFAADDAGTFRVKAVAAGSPAWEAGLTAGAEIASLRGAVGKPLPRADWPRFLDNPAPMKQMIFGVKQPDGKTVETGTLLLHRPVVKFYPFRDDEWLMYRYRDGYYDRSANGDQYVGWLTSKNNAKESPEFFPLNRFEKQLRQVAGGAERDKLGEAVRNLTADPEQALLPTLVPPRVAVAVGPPAQNARRVTVTVTPLARPAGGVNGIESVELRLNSHYRVGQPVRPPGPFRPGEAVTLTFDVPEKDLRAGRNTVEAVAVAKDAAYGTASTAFTTSATAKTRNLYVLSAGIGTYSAEGKGGKHDLLSPPKDCEAVRNCLEFQQGLVYDQATSRVLKNQHVTKAEIVAEIGRVRAASGPDDVFVLYLSGHGILAQDLIGEKHADHRFDRGWHYLIPYIQPTGENVLSLNTAERYAKWRQAFLSARELTDELATVRAQTIVLLDTCHAGGVTVEGRASVTKNAAGDLREHGVGPIVIAACAEQEEALDGNPDANEELSVFTDAIVRAMRNHATDFRTADTNHDGKLSVLELYNHARVAVVQRAKKTATPRHPDGHPQQPVMSPLVADLPDIIVAGRRTAVP